MPEIRTECLFTIALEVQAFDLGETPSGGRRIARFGTGSFEGPKLKGTVLPGGTGWMLIRHDDVREIDVRLALDTLDHVAPHQRHHCWHFALDRRMFIGAMTGGLIAAPIMAEAQPTSKRQGVKNLSVGLLEGGANCYYVATRTPGTRRIQEDIQLGRVAYFFSA